MICPTLSEGACADFGIEVDLGDGTRQKVCREGELHLGELAPEQELRSSLWYTRSSTEMLLDCYFWCTEDGEVPARDPDRADASDLIDSMASTTLKPTKKQYNLIDITGFSWNLAFQWRPSRLVSRRWIPSHCLRPRCTMCS